MWGVTVLSRAFVRRVGVPWLAASAAAALVSGGIAYAGDSSQGTVIHGCVNKVTRVIRIASRCKSTEVVLTWNVRGPAGPAGPLGLHGSLGVQGPAGISHVWTERFSDGGTALSSSAGTPTVIFDGSSPPGLAAGFYNVTATAYVTVNNDRTSCILALGSQSDTEGVSSATSSVLALQLNISVHTTTAAAPTLACYSGGASEQLSDASETIYQVGAVG